MALVHRRRTDTTQRYTPNSQASKPLAQVRAAVVKRPDTGANTRAPPQRYTAQWYAFYNVYVNQFRMAQQDAVDDSRQAILFQTFEQWLAVAFNRTTVPAAALSTTATNIPYAACKSDDLSMLSTDKWADVKTCTAYSKYEFMSGNVPTDSQHTKLCDTGCAKMLDRVVATKIPFCLVNFDDETVDFMSALFIMFWDCTEITVQATSVTNPPSEMAAPVGTSVKTTANPTEQQTTAEPTESSQATPAPPAPENPPSTPSIAKTSGAGSSAASFHCVTLMMMTATVATVLV